MKQSSSKSRKIILLLMIVGIIGGGYYAVFCTNLLSISNINLYDNQSISHDDIASYINLDPETNFFELNEYELKNKLIGHPQIKNAVVDKVFPNSLDIRIVERIGKVAVSYSGIYLVVDEDMVVVEVSKTPGDLYVINGYEFENFYIGYIINDDNYEILENAMNLAELIEVSDIIIHPEVNIVCDKIELVFNDEYKALFGDGSEMVKKFNDMLGIYKSQKEKEENRGIINVSFEGQATFKAFGE